MSKWSFLNQRGFQPNCIGKRFISQSFLKWFMLYNWITPSKMLWFIRVVTIYQYDSIPLPWYKRVWLSYLTFAYLRYLEKIKDAESHLRLDNNFLLNCSLAPPTRAAETLSETEALISNLYPTSKYKSKLVVWEYFGYRKDECLFVLEERHSSQKLVAKQPQKEETHRTCLAIFQNTIPLCRYSYVPFIT